MFSRIKDFKRGGEIMKQITAVLCKDGWLVEVSETRHLYSKDDVLKFIKENNLKVHKEFSNDEKIIAE